jgi:hypothetical protein
MQHSVTVGADECEVFQAGPLLRAKFGQSRPMVALDEAVAQFSLHLAELEVTNLASQGAKLSQGTLLLVFHKCSVPLSQSMETQQDSALDGFLIIFRRRDAQFRGDHGRSYGGRHGS